jgi:hypothetical protein
MGEAVPRFFRLLKDAPLIAAGEAEQYDGSGFCHAGHCAELTGLWVKGTAHGETDRGGAPAQLIEVEHGQA